MASRNSATRGLYLTASQSIIDRLALAPPPAARSLVHPDLGSTAEALYGLAAEALRRRAA